MQTTTNRFAGMDPTSAWEPWRPGDKEPWDAAAAAHLLRRAAFGVSKTRVRELLSDSPVAAVERMLTAHQADSKFEDESKELASAALATGDAKPLSVWWLHRMLNSPAPLLEKMTLFWHGHFATGADKVKDPHLMIEQNRLLRQHALGSFRDMTQAISKDAAMLIYLDSAVNRKAHPNENYARELMELFCLGEGNYTEADVQQLARCFTGWEVRRNLFRFNSYQHDDGKKNLLGKEDIESGEEAVEAVLADPHGPMFIAAKLFKFYIADEPAPPVELLTPLADQLRRDDWHLAGTVKRMLSSRLMFSPIVRARKVRSPIEFGLMWLVGLEGSANLKQLSEWLGQLGQSLFYPPNVKGWDGGRAWINSSTLVARANLLPSLLAGEATRFAGASLNAALQKNGITGGSQLIEWLESYQLAVKLSPPAREQIQSLCNGSSERRFGDALVLAAGLPEAQLS
ncbi:MAG: DUF1800 domain-containing protein [Pirellulales bacterium]